VAVKDPWRCPSLSWLTLQSRGQRSSLHGVKSFERDLSGILGFGDASPPHDVSPFPDDST
jgi:hypothetical protein